MTRQQLMNEYDMLCGNLNRMMVTNSMKELSNLYYYASNRLHTLYSENMWRLVDGKDSTSDL